MFRAQNSASGGIPGGDGDEGGEDILFSGQKIEEEEEEEEEEEGIKKAPLEMAEQAASSPLMPIIRKTG